MVPAKILLILKEKINYSLRLGCFFTFVFLNYLIEHRNYG